MLTSVQKGAQELKRQLRLNEHLALIELAWDAEVGGLAKYARITAIERDTLYVQADTATAMQELSLRRKELIRRINRHFPEPIIQCLNLRTA